MASVAPLKICHKGEIHRFYMDMDANSFDQLMELFRSTFNLRDGSFVVQYTDAEGDVITMTNEVEYRTALEAFKLEDGKFKTVRFSAVSRNQVVFQENVADPILKAIEKLVETLNAAMEKVKHEDWKLRAQSGVDYTNEALKNAAKDARESLHSARQSIQEIPFDQMLKETTEGIKAAAEGISIFAKEVAEEMKKEKLVQDATEGIKTAAERVSVFAKDAVEELKNLQIPQGMPMGFMPTPVPVYTEAAVNTTEPAPAQEEEVVAAEVVEIAQSAPVSADSDWEQVAEQTTPAVEEEIVEVVVSEEEKKWADQLATIRDIFPNVDTIRAIERLEEAKGNVEIVLNALMEEM